MNWTQELCEKFWKGVGATREDFYWRVSNGDRIIGYPNGTWDNPEELPLETLLDVLERLAWGNYLVIGVVASYQPCSGVAPQYYVRSIDYWGSVKAWDACATREQAVIAAICQLIGLKVGKEASREP